MAYSPIRSSADLAARLIPGITREDHWLEFKGCDENGVPYPKTDSGRNECRRDVAQFANASGGTIVIGAVASKSVLTEFAPGPDPNSLIEWVDGVVNQKLEPVPTIEPHVVQAQSGPEVVVINVAPALRLVGMQLNNGYEFPIRAADSKRYLRLAEIEARMQTSDRAHRLRLEQIGANDSVGLDARLDNPLKHNGWKVVRVEDDVVIIEQDGKEAPIPLTYVLAVFRAKLPNAEWRIDLDCCLSLHKAQQRVAVTRGIPAGRIESKYRTRSVADDGLA